MKRAASSKVGRWVGTGAPWVWLSAGAVSISLVMVFGLLFFIASKGLVYFWPHDVVELDHREDGQTVRLIGEMHDREQVSVQRLREAGITLHGDMHSVTRYLIKIGTRDVGGMDFRAVVGPDIAAERYLRAVKEDGKVVAEGEATWAALQARLGRAQQLFDEIRHIEKDEIGAINYQMERLRLQERKLALAGNKDPAAHADIATERALFQQRFEALQHKLDELNGQLQRDTYTVEGADGQQRDFPIGKMVRIYRPNAMDVIDKTRHYFGKLWEFVSTEPREANTEGGILPAIFGTVMLVIIMSVFVTPFGVIAAVYLREYARQGPFTRLVRIAVNNLAGVPAIVYGVFGLGFFVYFLGGNLDQLFFPESLPAPTFGTPGILWSSLTLAILTLPVVIVATEEGLTRVPRAVREGSLALGATKAETLWRVVLPMASQALKTGKIKNLKREGSEKDG